MKENLLRIKRLLERKCFASNYGSEYDVEPYLEVVQSIDNEGAFNYIQDCIAKAKEYFDKNQIVYDEIQLFPIFSLYFDSKYSDRYPYVIENKIKPIQDILRIYINGVGYENNKIRSTVDPDEIISNQEFVITFNEFKTMLETNGLSLEYSTFSDILKDYRNNKPTACKISNCKTKIKLLKR